MRCHPCQTADYELSTITETYARNGATVVIRDIPALVCPNCGDSLTEAEVTDRTLRLVKESAQRGVLLVMRDYALSTATPDPRPEPAKQPEARL